MARLLNALRAVPRDARLLLLSSYLGSVPIGLLMVFFPLYLHDLGMQSLLIGGIFTGAGLGATVLLMVIGPLADRFGRRAFLIAGTAVPMLGFIIFSLSTNPFWLVVASMLGGVGFAGGLGGGLVSATFNPLLVGTVTPRLRTTILSISEGVWAIAMATGSLLAGLPSLIVRAHLAAPLAADRTAFMACLLVTAAATVVLIPVRERPSAHPAQALPADGTAPADGRQALPTILKLAVFLALQGAGLGLVVQLMPLWMVLRFHSTTTAIAPWFAVAQVGGLLTLPAVPLLARRWGTGRLIVGVASLSTLLLVGVPLAPVLPIAGLFYIGRSALVSMQWPAQHSFLQGAVPPRLRGTATSVALGCWSLASALLPTLTGYLLDRRLLGLPLVLGICCYGTAAVWFWLTLRHTPLPEETPLAKQALARGEVSVSSAS